MSVVEYADMRYGQRRYNPLDAALRRHHGEHPGCERFAHHGRQRPAKGAAVVQGIGFRSLCSDCAQVMLAPIERRQRPTDEEIRRHRLARLRAGQSIF